MIDALIWISVGVVIGAFAGDRFGAKVRGLIMDVIARGKKAVRDNEP